MKRILHPRESVTEEPNFLRRPIGENEWKEIQKSLKNYVNSSSPEHILLMKEVSLSIASNIHELDKFMDLLCAKTCYLCSDICCHARGVFYNEVDLLFLTVYGDFYPPSQTRSSQDQKFCSYWESTKGCLLPRVSRPYVCTWFICGDQVAVLESLFDAKTHRYLNALYNTIRHGRLILASFCTEFYSKNI
ncbi:MAG: hypothetical protein N2260_02170 [Syntrophobacterales bacterium]|nr:hypothetical protein [Syntrophobacterales bacterium]